MGNKGRAGRWAGKREREWERRSVWQARPSSSFSNKAHHRSQERVFPFSQMSSSRSFNASEDLLMPCTKTGTLLYCKVYSKILAADSEIIFIAKNCSPFRDNWWNIYSISHYNSNMVSSTPRSANDIKSTRHQLETKQQCFTCEHHLLYAQIFALDQSTLIDSYISLFSV